MPTSHSVSNILLFLPPLDFFQNVFLLFSSFQDPFKQFWPLSTILFNDYNTRKPSQSLGLLGNSYLLCGVLQWKTINEAVLTSRIEGNR